MRGLLVRVGADLSVGGGRWNGPVHGTSRQFAYVPIPETRPVRPGLETTYSSIEPTLSSLKVELPRHTVDARTHLDPDFEYVTYGDRGDKGRQLARGLSDGDLIVFYAGLKDIGTQKLVYAIIGMFVVDKIVPITKMSEAEWHKNAHTRRMLRDETDDVIVFGKPEQSGRAASCVPIGEYRSRAYRVTKPLLAAWGGISANDGYLQRSAVFPSLLNAVDFWNWWSAQKVELVRRNN
jgi:putative DNA base modification enzyme with NMAD domain